MSFKGECIRGPYAGKLVAYPKETMPVLIKDGLFIREGKYEFMEGVWIWDGPAYPQRKSK